MPFIFIHVLSSSVSLPSSAPPPTPSLSQSVSPSICLGILYFSCISLLTLKSKVNNNGTTTHGVGSTHAVAREDTHTNTKVTLYYVSFYEPHDQSNAKRVFLLDSSQARTLLLVRECIHRNVCIGFVYNNIVSGWLSVKIKHDNNIIAPPSDRHRCPEKPLSVLRKCFYKSDYILLPIFYT